MLGLKSLHSVYSHKSEIILSPIFLNDGLHVFFFGFFFVWLQSHESLHSRKKEER